MPHLEHAWFAWTGNGRAGYELTGRSDGVVEADAQELIAWGPTHDSMHDSSDDAESFNFHPLPTGTFCISRTQPGGQQGGRRAVRTHCLVVQPDVLARFANNPFALIQAVTNEGAWQSGLTDGPRPAPIELQANGAAAVDPSLLAFLAADPGPENVAAALQAARDAVCLALKCPCSTPLIAGVINCLPPECRTEFSFTTGLKFSPRRPFRIVTLSDDPAERQWIAGYPNVMMLEVHRDERPPAVALDGWASLVRQALSTGRIPFMAARLSRRRPPLTLDDLPALGLQWIEDMETSDSAGPVEIATLASRKGRKDGVHRKFAKNAVAPAASIPTASASANLQAESVETLEKLEELDDLVYDALNGEAAALERLQTAWSEVASELDGPLLAESREQYLRYALSIWDECVRSGDGIRQPARAITALDVLSLLFDA